MVSLPRGSLPSAEDPFLAVPCVMGLKGPYGLTWRPSWRGCAWGSEDPSFACGVGLMESWVARGTVQYQKNRERQSLPGKALLDLRDKAWGNPSETGLPLSRPPFCATKAWQLVVIFSLQGPGPSNLIDKGSSDDKPNCICTTRWG